jgi:hypothetical protein
MVDICFGRYWSCDTKDSIARKALSWCVRYLGRFFLYKLIEIVFEPSNLSRIRGDSGLQPLQRISASIYLEPPKLCQFCCVLNGR